VMFHIIESIKVISVLLWPFMPGSSERIQDLLGLPRKGRDLGLDDIREWGKVTSGRSISRAPRLFPRVEGENKKADRGRESKEGKVEDLVSFKEFQKLDLRVGTIRGAELIPGSRKLIKLTVDIGEERTVVAGISGHYSEDDLIEKQVVLVANLEPVKLMGVESRGMVLAAEDESGVHLLIPDAGTVPGSRIR
jgi:methionyl-tRNA synthetase